MQIVYLNGEYVPIKDAKISVLDRGFLFGDGIYEVIPVYHGKLFRLQDHLKRLQHSLDNIRLKLDYSAKQWEKIFQGLLECNTELAEQSIYLQITRGEAPSRDHLFPESIRPTIFACTVAFPKISQQQKAKGISAITMADPRWQRCDIKAVTLLPNILSKQTAVDAGAAEAIFLKDGKAIEGCSSNLFIVKNNKLITPPLGPHMLAGITRNFVIEIARKNQITVEERHIQEKELHVADEIWFTSSTREMIPVIQLDDKTIGTGKAGPLWQQVNDYFQVEKVQ